MIFSVFSALLLPTYALNPIVVGGNMLFDSVTGDRFYMKGITYGYQVSDAYEHYWKDAIDNIVTLTGVNTVRVYNIDPQIDQGDFKVNNTYDRFMAYCESKGLYVVVAITPPGFAPWTYCVLNRNGVPTGGYQGGPDNCYPWCLLTYGQAVVRAFARYTNTLMFVVGNEVMNDGPTWKAAPCVKGYLADLKSYMRRCGSNMRYIPLMYAAADNGIISPMTVLADDNNRYKAEYLTCGSPETSLDVFGLNIYRWCSSLCTFASCAYKRMHDQLTHLPIPLILSEFGCREFYYDGLGPTPAMGQRDWRQLQALYGPNMTGSWSGGTAYAYGVEGGDGFAFWTGGTYDFFGPPGTTKACGYPGNVCNADNFKTQLGLINPVNTNPVGAGVCKWTPPGYQRIVPPCPTNFTLSLGVDTDIPSRETAPGFVPLSCPSFTLTPIEQTLVACNPSPTAAPSTPGATASPTSPTSPGSPTTPVAPTSALVEEESSATRIVLIILGVLLAVGAVAGGFSYFRQKRRHNAMVHSELMDTEGGYEPPIQLR